MDGRRAPLAVGSAPAYDRDDLYRFFAVAFGAAPGVTYMGQLQEAADAGMSIKSIVNVFTTKPQFLEIYPANLTSQEFAQRLVDNVVGTSATEASKAEAVADIVAALSPPANWSRGDITFAIFNNLARKPANDAQWAGTARKMANQVVYAKHYTETMKVDTTELTQLRAVVKTVTENSPVSGQDLSTLIQSAVQAAVAQSLDLPPLARALSDPVVARAGATVQLNGGTSFDFRGRPLTYAWKLDSRPTSSSATLSSASSAQTTFVADLPGRYGASLVVSNGVSSSKSTRVVVTAVPAGAATTGLAVVTSLNTGACAALTGCTSQVLTDFMLTMNQCTVTKVGATVSILRPGVEPISADFSGDVVDRASISGNQLVIGLRGQAATDQVNIQIDKSTGAVLGATGSATTEGITRSIDCKVVASGTFPATAAVASITSVLDLLKALDPRECRGISNGITFSSCGSATVPDFSLTVGMCQLAKTGQTLTVSKAGSTPVSAKLNGDLLDAVGEAFDPLGLPLGYLSFTATDSDAAAGTQQSITLRIVPSTLVVSLSATEFSTKGANQIGC